MRNAITLIVILLTIIPINFGCNENTNQVQAQDYIIPLAIGNKWIGRVQIIDTNGSVLSTSYDTLLVIKDTMINGVLWYMMNDSESLIRNTSWGLYRNNSVNTDWEQPFLKFPASLGQQWELDTIMLKNVQTGEPDTVRYGIELALNDTSITVPEGTYNCYYYRPYSKKLDGSSSDVVVPLIGWHWYAPNLGPIKFIYFNFSDQSGNTKEVWELIYRELY